MRNILILALFAASCAAQTQIMPTLMICGSPANTNIFSECNLSQPGSANITALSVRPVHSAPYCNEINFGTAISVKASATIACSIATQIGPYEYAISMYDPSFAGAFSSNVGFPFLVNPGKTWTVNFNTFQQWINNEGNQTLTGFQYVSSSYSWNKFVVTGSIFINFGKPATKPVANQIRNLDKIFAI